MASLNIAVSEFIVQLSCAEQNADVFRTRLYKTNVHQNLTQETRASLLSDSYSNIFSVYCNRNANNVRT